MARGAAKTLLHICRDDGRMARTLQALQFFYPDIDVVSFPAWDCLPYDRVSPNAEITSRRIDALTRLIEAGDAPRIVLTTMNAALQRVPPRKAFEDRVLRLAVRGSMPVERLLSFISRNGYSRADTVREPGSMRCAAASSIFIRQAAAHLYASISSATSSRISVSSTR